MEVAMLARARRTLLMLLLIYNSCHDLRDSAAEGQAMSTPGTTNIISTSVATGGPYIMSKPGNQTVVEGQRVSFPCGTEGYPSIIVHTWFKDQVDIRTTDGHKAGRITIQSDGSLLIKPAVKSDRGWYTCRPSNGLGHDEASAYLNVVYKPLVLPMPPQLTWAKGYNQQIDCPVDANPPITKTTWVKDQLHVESTGRFDTLANGTLLVSNVQESDAGSYRCTPENTMGLGLSSNRVQVLVKDPPIFTVKPQTFYIRNVGESVIMNCSATGTPAVSIQWIKAHGKLDVTSDRVTVTEKYLEIQELTKDDHGKYECRAINTLATVITVTELRIDNTTPHAPFNVTVVPGLFNVTISWQPAYDGGTPQFYVLWFRKVGQPDWLTMSMPGEAVTYFNLYSLQPATEYEFKILSRNSYGNGSFSNVVRQRTLAPFSESSSASKRDTTLPPLGYDPNAVNYLPVDRKGLTYYPEVLENIGPQPSAPMNLTAQVKDRDIHLNWRVPRISSVPFFSYKIEFQHDNKWQYYHRRITGNMTNSAVMTNMLSGAYDIRLRSYGILAYSPISNVVHVNVPEGTNKPSGNAGASSSSDDIVLPEALVGGIVGGVLFLLVAVLLALVAIFHSKKKDRKAKEKKYNDVNYGKPDEINGRHHEPAAKRDRWQHNGGGDLVTSLNNTDSIFFLPQTRSLDQSTQMRPSLLFDNREDRDPFYSRGREGYGRDYGRQVPLTHEINFMSDRSQAGSFRPRPAPARLDTRNLTCPNQTPDSSFEQQPPLSRSLPTNYSHFPGTYVSSHDITHSYERPQQSALPQDHPPISKSYSFPSHPLSNNEQFPALSSQHPSHSTHLPLSSYTSTHQQDFSRPHHSFSYSHPSSPRDVSFNPAVNTSLSHSKRPHSSDTQHPNFQSEDDDDDDDDDDEVFGKVPHTSRQVPGFPRYSSLKPGHASYLKDGGVFQGIMPGLEDISSVVDPASEQPSQVQPNSSLSPSGHHPLNQTDNSNIPGYYINTGDNTITMITPSQKHLHSPNKNESKDHPPLGYTQDDLQRVVQRLHEAPRARSLGPPTQPFHQPNISAYSDPIPQSRTNLQDNPPHRFWSHSSLRGPEDYSTLDSRDSHGSVVPPRKAPYYMADLRKEPYYPEELPRPRAQSEGSQRLKGLPRNSEGRNNYGNRQDRPPYGSTSYPDMLLPQYVQRPSSSHHGDQYTPQEQLDYIHRQPHHSYQHLPAALSLDRGRNSAPFHKTECEPQLSLDPIDALPTRYSGGASAYSDPFHRYRDHPSHRYGDETLPIDSGSHSSGIGSRNTSHSTGVYPPQQRWGSTGKGSASVSSGQDPDISLDMMTGRGGVPGMSSHRRDISGDENYEFDSLNALENDIMDDLTHYSHLSGDQDGAGSTHSSHGNVQLDSSFPQPSKPSRYPNSEQRFERLREEFKQYRQQHHPPSDGLVPPPTAFSALPIGINGEPLYPMDSEML